MHVYVNITFDSGLVSGDPLTLDMMFVSDQAMQQVHWEVCDLSQHNVVD